MEGGGEGAVGTGHKHVFTYVLRHMRAGFALWRSGRDQSPPPISLPPPRFPSYLPPIDLQLPIDIISPILNHA